MIDSLTIVDVLIRGLAIGGMLVLGLSALQPGVNREHRLAIVLASVSIMAWLITESHVLWRALGDVYLLCVPAAAVGGLFWFFVLTIFEDAPLRLRNLAPAGVQAVLGFVEGFLQPPLQDIRWWTLNIISGVLALHVCYLVARGWSGDLMEGRRRLRGLLLGLAAAFAAVNVALAFANRLDPQGPWLLFTISRAYGGALMSAIILATVTMFLQVRTAVFGPVRRAAATPDSRAEAVDRQLLARLNEVMAADGWRREGLTIGELARQLDAPEHRLRRLINQRLGHRNFAEFVNSFRIEAAKRRLADPAEARTTVATIAFDLGYGSLGPFNRAFRAATGRTPTEWRREALGASPDLQEAV